MVLFLPENKSFMKKKNIPRDQITYILLICPGQSTPLKKTCFPVAAVINREQLIKIYEGEPSPGHRDCPLIGGWRTADGC